MRFLKSWAKIQNSPQTTDDRSQGFSLVTVIPYLFNGLIDTGPKCVTPSVDDARPSVDLFTYFAPMFAYLKGSFAKKTPAAVIVDVGGVGYDVQISLNTYSRIQNLDSGVLQTHLLVREDAQILYGFFDTAEKELFLMLISVSGIGAGTARVMLSYMKPDEISRAIVQGNTRVLEGIKGIGRKTAERVVLELRDKLSKQPIESTDATFSTWKGNSLQADALEALIALGINRQAADAAVQKVLKSEEGLGVEAVIKKALQSL